MQRAQVPSWDAATRSGAAKQPRGTVFGSRSQPSQSQSQSQPAEEAADAPALVVDAAVKKARRKLPPRPKLTPGILASNAGIPTVYKQFHKIPLRGRGHELDDLNLLLMHYETWAAGLLPSFAFEDFVEKLEASGGKGPVRELMKKLRQVERGEFRYDHFFGKEGEESGIDDDMPQGEEADPDYVDPAEAAAFERAASPAQRSPPPAPPPPVNQPMSEEARQRAEANRQRALERLRERQQEAERAAAAAAAAEQQAEQASQDAGPRAKRLRPMRDSAGDSDEEELEVVGGPAPSQGHGPTLSASQAAAPPSQQPQPAPSQPPAAAAPGGFSEFDEDDALFADEAFLMAVDQLVAQRTAARAS
eukprot:tig00020554_g10901.t1